MQMFSLEELEKQADGPLQGTLTESGRIVGNLTFKGKEVLIMSVQNSKHTYNPKKPGWAYYGTYQKTKTSKKGKVKNVGKPVPCFYVSNHKREVVSFIQYGKKTK